MLIRDVAYDSLPKRERGALHLEVARWAERELADREDEVAELLAAHYVAALRYEEEFTTADTPELRALRESTYRWARAAGGRASALDQLDQAALWLKIAIDQARSLRIDGRERAILAVEYFRGGRGYEPFGTLDDVVLEAIGLLQPLSDRSAEDESTLAALIAEHAYLLYVSDRLDEARAVLRDAIAERQDEAASVGRARLLTRLGWTYWRAGPIAEAVPIIERAIAEAQASGADDVERWALHDLGVAIGLLGRVAECVGRLEESRRLAFAANDRMLIARCDINVPAMLQSNGATLAELAPVWQEGLQRARRSVDRSRISWMALNIADMLCFAGRLREALAFEDEAIEAGTALGDHDIVDFARMRRAWIRHAMGDPDAAFALWRGRVVVGTIETQNAIYPVIWDAWTSFESGPREAVERLRQGVEQATESYGLLDGGRGLMRMATRTGDEEALQVGTAALRRVTSACSGPLRAVDSDWATASLLEPADAVTAFVGVAEQWLALECPLPAADAYADVALAARRAGSDATRYETEALRLYSACEAVPTLGPLPETRWVDRRQPSPSRSS